MNQLIFCYVDDFEFHWVASKTGGFSFDDSELITTSGPHKIFLTYDKPRLDTVNVLGLNKICNYAQNEYIDTMVAMDGVNGVYGEGWTYAPGDSISEDPLSVIRRKRGQCGDNANLLTYLYKSVGLEANSLVIYNGIDVRDTINVLFWHYSRLLGSPYISLLSDTLTSCDDTTREWYFNYHAVSHYSGYLCDASLGQFREDTDYDAWWRFYITPRSFQPPYDTIEPPNIPPVYYDWDIFVPYYPNIVLPKPAIRYEIDNFHHP